MLSLGVIGIKDDEELCAEELLTAMLELELERKLELERELELELELEV
jgi:hypothetical protein